MRHSIVYSFICYSRSNEPKSESRLNIVINKIVAGVIKNIKKHLVLMGIFVCIQTFPQSQNLLGQEKNVSSITSISQLNLLNKVNENENRSDSIITTALNGEGLKLKFYYDEKGRLEEYYIWARDNISWQKRSKFERNYDENGNLISEIRLDWITNKWDSSSQNKYTYHQGRKIKSIYKIYQNNNWINQTSAVTAKFA